MNTVDERRPDVPTAITVAVILLTTAFAFHDVPTEVMRWPDTWSYLELSNSVFKDFYRQYTARTFDLDTEYSRSFPPLWPVLIAVARKAGDIGILTGVALNGLVALGLAGALIGLAVRLKLPSWVGTATFIALMSVTAFNSELQAGRTIPLAVTFLVFTLFVVVGPLTKKSAFLAGFCMGLGCLTRFDVMPVAIGVCLAIWRMRGWRLAMLYMLAFGIVLSPWLAYCYHHFGTLFASDNTRQLLRAEGGHVMEFFDTPPANDLKEHPVDWIVGLFRSKAPRVAWAMVGAVRGSFALLLAAALLVVWGGRQYVLPPTLRRFMQLGLWLLPFTLAASLAVGYGESRYYCGAAAIVLFVMCALFAVCAPEAWTPTRASLLLIVLMFLPVFCWANERYVNWRDGKTMAPAIPFEWTDEMASINFYVNRNVLGEPMRILFTNEMQAAVYGALTPETSRHPRGTADRAYNSSTGETTMLPDFKHGTFRRFVSDWRVTHVYDPEQRLAKIDTTGVRFIPLNYPYLFQMQVEP